MLDNWLPTRARRADEEKDTISGEHLLPSSSSSIDDERSSETWVPSSSPRRRNIPWAILNYILFVFSVSVLGRSLYERYVGLDAHTLLKKTSFFSPVLEKFNITAYTLQADGALFESDNPSPYRNTRKPDPKVEAAWEEFDTIRTFPITRDDVVKLGKDPEFAVKFPEEYGLGSEAYIAQLDIFHQIHCLNLLRHLAWAEYDRDENHGKHPYSELHWIHVSHCTDMLMQTLMCQGSLDVLTFNWMETEEWPFPDFYVNHQCRDFDSIVQWQEDHALPLMMGRNISRPEGAREIPAPDAYYEMFPDKKVSLQHDEHNHHEGR